MKCLLHIGTEKTGSTLLQEWLYSNRTVLSAQRIFLSDVLWKSNNRLLPGYFQHMIDDFCKGQNIRTVEDKAAYFEGFLDKFSSEIDAASEKHDLFVITSEHFHSRVTREVDVQRVFDFLQSKFTDIQVVGYFRPQADMAISSFSTAMWVGWDGGNLDAYLKTHVKPDSYYYNFKKIADNWSNAFGKDRCSFRIYDRDSFPDGDIRKDFLSTFPMQMDPEGLSYDVQSANESLSDLNGLAFEMINRHVPYWDEQNGGFNPVNKELKRRTHALPSLQTGMIQSAQRDSIMRMFADSNAEFLRDYCPPNAALEAKTNRAQSDDTYSYGEVRDLVADVYDTLAPFAATLPKPHLTDTDAENLRDIALKIDHDAQLTVQDALVLMRLAQRARPTGPFINKMVEVYSERLKTDT